MCFCEKLLGIYMSDYKFESPSKCKAVYIIINIFIVISIAVIGIIFQNNIILISIPIAVLCMFNGIWSINRKLYSFIHRDNKNYSINYSWIIAIILGSLLSILAIIYLIIK